MRLPVGIVLLLSMQTAPEQFRSLRTRFLTTYTGCIAHNHALHAPSAN
jgi:hypothetical protein